MTQGCFVLGLTGSIGMGKSTTAQMFRELDVPVWDADQTVADLYAKDGAAIAGLEALNPNYVKDGTANRSAIKAEIAVNSDALVQIEAVVHPLVRASRQEFLSQHAANNLVVLDIPLLFETNTQDQVDAVLVVTAPAETQRKRVMDRGTMTLDMFNAILAKQMPDAEKRAKADYVIETLSLEATKADVTSLVKDLRAKHA